MLGRTVLLSICLHVYSILYYHIHVHVITWYKWYFQSGLFGLLLFSLALFISSAEIKHLRMSIVSSASWQKATLTDKKMNAECNGRKNKEIDDDGDKRQPVLSQEVSWCRKSYSRSDLRPTQIIYKYYRIIVIVTLTIDSHCLYMDTNKGEDLIWLSKVSIMKL